LIEAQTGGAAAETEETGLGTLEVSQWQRKTKVFGK